MPRPVESGNKWVRAQTLKTRGINEKDLDTEEVESTG